MENIREIRQEVIEVVGLPIKMKANGLNIYSHQKWISQTKMESILTIVQNYRLSYYIDFDFGYLRIY